MEFRRSGQRRRRVLMEERQEEHEEADGDAPASDARGYSESALAQPSLTDLIPTQPVRVLMALLIGATLLVGLLVLDDYATHRRLSTAAFRLGAPGSLASWFASTLLMWTAAGAVLTFLIRRHRTDDYRGAYYIWLWATAALVLFSVAATAPWHRELNRLLTSATSIDLGANGWWLATAGAAGMLLLLRIAVEIRRCRTALMLLLISAAGYAVATLITLGLLWPDAEPLNELASQFGILASHLSLSYAVWWNARHVQLDARGVHAEKAARRAEARALREMRREEKREAKLQQQSERKSKRSREETADEEDDQQEAAKAKSRRKSKRAKQADAEQDEQGSEQRPARQKRRRRGKQTDEAAESERDQRSEAEDDESPDTLDLEEGRKLSKAERRRQRKQKRSKMAA